MKTYNDICDELWETGGILKDKHGTRYFKPGSYMLHREDGPAVEQSDGKKSWWYNDKWIMETDSDVTPEQVIDFRLRIL